MPRQNALLKLAALSSLFVWTLPIPSLAAPRDVAQGHAPQVAEQSGAPDARAIIRRAQQYLGVPYRWGGTGQQGFDCSGFVMAVFSQHGYGMPRVSREQAHVGLSVSRAELKPGDLLFFSSQPHQERITHVAISLGGQRFIHAALGRGEVSYDALTERYFDQRLVLARRPLALPPGQYATNVGTAVPNVAADTPEALASIVARRATIAQPFVAPKAQDLPGTVAKDALVEHTQDLPPQLDMAAAGEQVLAGTRDHFGEDDPARRDTGLGVRLGMGVLDAASVATATPELRYFGPSNALQVALALPLVWRFERRDVPGHTDTPTWESVRQDGRILRSASFGRPGARLYAALRRDVALSLNDGSLMRHFMPNAISTTFNDLVIQSNALSAQLNLSFRVGQLSALVDDVFGPSVLGFGGRIRPFALQTGFLRRLELQAGLAADVRAPSQLVAGMLPPPDSLAVLPRHTHALWTFNVGAGLRAIDTETQALRLYTTLASVLHPGGGPTSVTGSFGSTWGHIWPRGVGAAHTLLARTELRVSGAHARPAIFDLDYAQARKQALLTDDFGTSNLSLQDVLGLQHNQPVTLSGLIELQGSLANYLEAGVSLADGGPVGRVTGVPRPSDASVTAYLGVPQVAVGPGGRALSARLVWHQASLRAPWPWRASQWPRTFFMALVHLDMLDWLDASIALRKPLGIAPAGARAWTLEGSLGVHYTF